MHKAFGWLACEYASRYGQPLWLLDPEYDPEGCYQEQSSRVTPAEGYALLNRGEGDLLWTEI